MKGDKLNWNTLLLAILIGLGTWSVRTLFSVHDDILLMNAKMPYLITRQEFDIAISEIKTKQSALDAKLVELQTRIK